MSGDSILSPARQPEDADAALRPKTLAEFVGQAAAKDNLRVFIESARSRREAMDFVDEQHVALFEIGEQCGEVARLGNDGTGGSAKADAEFARDDLRQRGLAEAGRTNEQHVIQRLAPLARRLDEDREIFSRLSLPDELRQQLRA